MDSISELSLKLKQKLEEVEELKRLIADKSNSKETASKLAALSGEILSNAEIQRYGRQMILPEIGKQGQCSLKKSSVLIVGAGGLGCPAAIYLAAAGVGCLGIVDYDEVEVSNLHRQILHSERKKGMSKAMSAAKSCMKLNSNVTYVPHCVQMSSQNALDIINRYDVVLDCTDNVATRYLLNDACVLAKKPLVSGSALRFEGQLTVYNHNGGLCYRCLYPIPPPPETVTNCSDGGVLGVVPGIIGSLQALEAIKIICNITSPDCQKSLLFDGLSGCFRTIKLRSRQTACCVCGDKPSITSLIDYEQFCGSSATDKSISLELLQTEDRISVKELSGMINSDQSHLLVDVREPVEYEIGHITNSINIPFETIHKNVERIKEQFSSDKNVLLICKRGNDSQQAVMKLKKILSDNMSVKDIKGGLTAWTSKIDPDFPMYW